MIHKNKLLVISALILSANLISQSLFAQTLVEAVDKTVKSNPTILAKSNFSLSVDQTIDQARSGYYPKVDLNLGTGYERTDSPTTRPDHNKSLHRNESGLIATQMLYDGFATKNSVDQTSSLAESAGYNVADIAETISLRTIRVYLDVLRRQKLLSLTEINLASHERINSHIQLRAKSGVSTKIDAVQSTGRVALSKANLTSNQGNLEDANTNYLRVVGNLPESPEEPSDECCKNAPATVENAIKVAYHQHPALRASIANHEASLAQQQGAQAPMHPRVDLELGTTANNNLDGVDGHNNDSYAMFRMRYNLLNGGADKARIKETEFISDREKASALAAKREIEHDVRLAWNSLKSISSRIPALELHIKSSEKTREAYQKQFNLGQRTLLDLLNTENEVLTAKIDYTNAYYDRIYACYWLAETMGKLLEELELTAPEQALTITSSE